MKKLMSLALVLALSFQCLSKLGLLTFFYFYQDYVIEHFCENKNEPQLLCEGTCFLQKGLEKDDNNQSTKKTTETLSPIEIPSFLISSHSQNKLIVTWIDRFYTRNQDSYSFLYITYLFHPPKNV